MAVITSSVDKITFVVAEITFKVVVITSSVDKITFLVPEIFFKVAVITFDTTLIPYTIYISEKSCLYSLKTNVGNSSYRGIKYKCSA